MVHFTQINKIQGLIKRFSIVDICDGKLSLIKKFPKIGTQNDLLFTFWNNSLTTFQKYVRMHAQKARDFAERKFGILDHVAPRDRTTLALWPLIRVFCFWNRDMARNKNKKQKGNENILVLIYTYFENISKENENILVLIYTYFGNILVFIYTYFEDIIVLIYTYFENKDVWCIVVQFSASCRCIRCMKWTKLWGPDI